MGRRGRKRQLEVESRYWQPAGGDHPQDGVAVAGGERWGAAGPAGRGGPSSRYLSRLERQRIATLRERGLGVREIARRLDRAPSTISREVRRNLRPHDRDRYDADLAHARAAQRARRPRPRWPCGPRFSRPHACPRRPGRNRPLPPRSAGPAARCTADGNRPCRRQMTNTPAHTEKLRPTSRSAGPSSSRGSNVTIALGAANRHPSHGPPTYQEPPAPGVARELGRGQARPDGQQRRR
jgi:transposase-like protein